MKLNLGCGQNLLEGYVNVDKFGEPDLKHDLEEFPWPWDDASVTEVRLDHVLEHLGQATETYFKIIQELYRVCKHSAKVSIVVPHFRHQHFYDDPTHVRAITPLGMQLFSKSLNEAWKKQGAANSPLGLYLDVDFELISTALKPSSDWFRLHPSKKVDLQLLQQEAAIYNNLIEQYEMVLKVVKPGLR